MHKSRGIVLSARANRLSQTALPSYTELPLESQKHPTAFHERPTGRRLFRCRVARAGGMALRAAPKISETEGPPEVIFASCALHALCSNYRGAIFWTRSKCTLSALLCTYIACTPPPLRLQLPVLGPSSGRASRSLSFRPTETVSTVHTSSFPSSNYLIQCDADPRRR